MEIKKQLLEYCLSKSEERLTEIVYAIQQAQEGIESDTKSSAGDKYETSREMIQQDLNRYQNQLLQAKKDAVLLQNIILDEKETIGPGSLVKTDKGSYFIAISLGKYRLQDEDFMIISGSSPIGRLLIGNKVGDTIQFNGNVQKIKAVH
ncbi:GreA/GreB family elongation factor [Sphingobacterium deserti]|uniref:3-oxoacyl-ACP synthase n=1 Tax=Sphingobacterium deserti TaxID=1229276 RepID=A0A0B8T5L6_9SPHI|nr:GreA/GreB family elongation factor [Sphingobacterium deserti]KGE15923.1 hypothetical protein DI53_0357 [Sphingobacterium deserti]